MKPLLMAAVLCALALGGCSTAQSLLGESSIAHAAPKTIADAEKALTVAHLAYQAIGVSLKQAAESGALHGADAATALALYDKTGSALELADRADEAANAQGVLAQVASTEGLLSQIAALIPK